MDLRTLPRTAVGASLQVARIPVDLLQRFAGHDDRPFPPAVAFDRVDATVRSTIGMLIGDDVLKEEGRRRRLAADERERALHLEATAEQVATQAQRQADKAEARIEEEAQARQRRIAESEARQRAAARQQAEAKEDAIAQRDKATRLAVVESETSAIREKEAAAATERRSRRLAQSAAAKKTTRKRA